MSVEQINPHSIALRFAEQKIPSRTLFRSKKVKKLAIEAENEIYKRHLHREEVDYSANVIIAAIQDPQIDSINGGAGLTFTGDSIHTIEEPHSEELIQRLLTKIIIKAEPESIAIKQDNETTEQAVKRIIKHSYRHYSEKQTGSDWHNKRTEIYQLNSQLALATHSFESDHLYQTRLFLLPLDQNPNIAQALLDEAQKYSQPQLQT